MKLTSKKYWWIMHSLSFSSWSRNISSASSEKKWL